MRKLCCHLSDIPLKGDRLRQGEDEGREKQESPRGCSLWSTSSYNFPQSLESVFDSPVSQELPLMQSEAVLPVVYVKARVFISSVFCLKN